MGSAFTGLLVILAILVLLGGLVAAVWRFIMAEGTYKALQGGVCAIAGVVLFLGLMFIASFRPVQTGQVAVIDKKMLGSALKGGDIIATEGEMGIQDEILRDGWHSGLWPFVYELEYRNITEIGDGQLGIITTIDGQSLPPGQVFAPEWNNLNDLLDAETFLAADSGDNIGYKGQQTTVARPGKYAFNFRLYRVETVEAPTVAAGQVGVIKSNVGEYFPQSDQNNGIVPRGYRGIWDETYPPGVVALNPNAYQVIKVPTTVRIVDYSETNDNDDEFTQGSLEQMISVKTKDGYIFPVDVRVEYRIEPRNAPIVVSQFYNEKTGTFENQLRQKINSTTRSVFRNNAETAEALDYINQRSTQESQSLALITSEMEDFGVTVLRVAIGDIDPNGESAELTALLKTQTDRQLAVQQEQTFIQQQAAAKEEQKLNDEQQRATEVRRLATADFDDQIAEREAARAIKLAEGESQGVRLKAQAEADRIRLAALAQAEGTQAQLLAEAEGVKAKGLAEAQAYLEKARAVGGDNLAMIELIERIASGDINITPNIMVGSAGDGSVGAAIGAMLLQRMQNGEPILDLSPIQAEGDN